MTEATKLQRGFVYIILALLAVIFGAAVCIACINYTPYSFVGGISISAKSMLWYFVLLPSAVLPLALWMSNMLSPTLSRYSLLAVWVSCCYFIVIPRLYRLFDPTEMALTTSALAFFLIAIAFTVVIKDLNKKGTKGWINISLGLMLTVSFMLLTVILSYFIIQLSFFDRFAVCYAVPLLCLIYAISCVLDMYSISTMALQTVTVGYATLCAAFRIMNTRALFFVLMGLLILTCVWQVIDIIKYIRSNKNDRKSCNA
ncbi:MAG: hypothetical protein IKT46_09665 [Clostridia bacterium]|nr:hypothetical protein [Clostridia bacterium]